MKFDELVTKVRGLASKVDVSNQDFLAVQINITGKESGVFYVEVKDHKISVEPYDYHDRNCAITMSLTQQESSKWKAIWVRHLNFQRS